jgi:hypothetical protein
MKKIILSFVISIFAFSTVFSQETSQFFFEYETSPLHNKIEVHINFKDGKINTDKPFTYYDKSKNNQEISERKLKKELRLKLKKNKKINNDSYFITISGLKEMVISANYSDKSKSTTVFYRPKKVWYNIKEVTFYYKDENEKKLDKIKVTCEHFAEGRIAFFEFKK